MSDKVIQIKDGNDNALPISNDSASNYCKFPDGTLICYGYNRMTPKSLNGTQRGNLYFYECLPNIEFPVSFISTPTITFGKRGGHVSPVGWSNVSNTHIIEVDMLSGVSSLTSTDEFLIAWLAIGRWK